MSLFKKKYLLLTVSALLLSVGALEAKSTVGGIIFTNTYFSHTEDDTQTSLIQKMTHREIISVNLM